MNFVQNYFNKVLFNNKQIKTIYPVVVDRRHLIRNFLRFFCDFCLKLQVAFGIRTRVLPFARRVTH
jgi:hypothetical protein